MSKREQALAYVQENMKRKRSSREGTYLQRIVELCEAEATEDNPLSRQQLIAYIALDIAEENFAADGGYDPENEEHAEFFAVASNKCKNQVAAALSNSQNNTSLTFNPRYKDEYQWGSNSKGYWLEPAEPVEA